MLPAIRDYQEAITILETYDPLPQGLQLPAFLVAMNQEYGERPVTTGRVRSLVERFEYRELQRVTVTPGYEAVPRLSPQERFERDVQDILPLLEYNPYTRKVEFYLDYNRQWFTDLEHILAIMQGYLGKSWVTLKHLKVACKRRAKMGGTSSKLLTNNVK